MSEREIRRLIVANILGSILARDGQALVPVGSSQFAELLAYAEHAADAVKEAEDSRRII